MRFRSELTEPKDFGPRQVFKHFRDGDWYKHDRTFCDKNPERLSDMGIEQYETPVPEPEPYVPHPRDWNLTPRQFGELCYRLGYTEERLIATVEAALPAEQQYPVINAIRKSAFFAWDDADFQKFKPIFGKTDEEIEMTWLEVCDYAGA